MEQYVELVDAILVRLPRLRARVDALEMFQEEA